MADNEHEDLVDYDDEEVSVIWGLQQWDKKYVTAFQRTLNIRYIHWLRDESRVEFDLTRYLYNSEYTYKISIYMLLLTISCL